MLGRFILGATLLFSSAIAAPVEATTQATAAAPGQDILSSTANRLRGTIARLNALNGNPALAAEITAELSSISQGVDAAASQIDAGPNLDWGTALAFAPVLTILIGSAKSVTNEVQAKRQLFNPPAMASAMDQNFRAVSHLKAAFDHKTPDAYDWIINGLADGTLVQLQQTRDSFAGAGPAPYSGGYPSGYPAAPPAYPAAYPAAAPYGAAPYGAPSYGAPSYGVAPVPVPAYRPY